MRHTPAEPHLSYGIEGTVLQGSVVGGKHARFFPRVSFENLDHISLMKQTSESAKVQLKTPKLFPLSPSAVRRLLQENEASGDAAPQKASPRRV